MKNLNDEQVVSALEPLMQLGANAVAFVQVRSAILSLDLENEIHASFWESLQAVSSVIEEFSKLR